MIDWILTIGTWLFIWFENDLDKITRMHEFSVKYRPESLKKQLLLYAYEIRIRQLMEKEVKKANHKL